NRRELASLAGLDPTPYQSGDLHRERGISKAGNGRVRWTMVELAWMWLRHQPNSALSLWYQRRFGCGNARSREGGVVALAGSCWWRCGSTWSPARYRRVRRWCRGRRSSTAACRRPRDRPDGRTRTGLMAGPMADWLLLF